MDTVGTIDTGSSRCNAEEIHQVCEREPEVGLTKTVHDLKAQVNKLQSRHFRCLCVYVYASLAHCALVVIELFRYDWFSGAENSRRTSMSVHNLHTRGHERCVC